MKGRGTSVKRLITWQFAISFIIVATYVVVTLIGGGLSASMVAAVIVTLVLCGNKVTFEGDEKHPTVMFAGPAIVNALVPILFAIWTPSCFEDKTYLVLFYLLLFVVWNAKMRMDDYFKSDHVLLPMIAILSQAIIIYVIFVEDSKAFICQVAEKLL